MLFDNLYRANPNFDLHAVMKPFSEELPKGGKELENGHIEALAHQFKHRPRVRVVEQAPREPWRYAAVVVEVAAPGGRPPQL